MTIGHVQKLNSSNISFKSYLKKMYKCTNERVVCHHRKLPFTILPHLLQKYIVFFPNKMKKNDNNTMKNQIKMKIYINFIHIVFVYILCVDIGSKEQSTT